MYKPLPRLCDKRPSAYVEFGYSPIVRAQSIQPVTPVTRKFLLALQFVLLGAILRDLILVIRGKEPRYLYTTLNKKK